MSSAGGAHAQMTPVAFIKKWKRASLTERQSAQEHFIDLCSLFGHPTPSEDDPTGERFAFEKGAAKVGGGRGFADVWKRDYFAWEYNPLAIAIARAGKHLDNLRNAWLNPPDLVRVEAEVVPSYPDRILLKDTVAAATLRERTLTNLYNQHPQWLVDAHRDLDTAVAAAYGWAADISEEDALARLLELNVSRAAASETGVQEKTKRKPRPLTPEEARRQPQFKLPIAGGKQGQKHPAATEPALIDRQKTQNSARHENESQRSWYQQRREQSKRRLSKVA